MQTERTDSRTSEVIRIRVHTTIPYGEQFYMMRSGLQAPHTRKYQAKQPRMDCPCSSSGERCTLAV